MKKHMLKSKWLVLLYGSVLMLVWRLMDFVFEAADGKFHMSRWGIALRGADAQAMQLIIIFGIFGSIAFMWKVANRLERLRITDPNRWQERSKHRSA